MNTRNLAWIHLENLKFFTLLGATPEEQSIGQNITVNLSLCISYLGTQDKLSQTVDYGEVYQVLQKKLTTLSRVYLLEFLAEQILLEIEENFPKIYGAKVMIQKGYVPLKNFSGTSRIEAEKQFITF